MPKKCHEECIHHFGGHPKCSQPQKCDRQIDGQTTPSLCSVFTKSHQSIRHCWWFCKMSDDFFKIIRHILIFWKTCREYSDWNVCWCFQNVWWFAQNQKTYCLMIRKTFHKQCYVRFQLCWQGTSLPYTLRNLEHNFLKKVEQRTERKRTERNKTPSHNKTPEYVNLTYQLPTVC